MRQGRTKEEGKRRTEGRKERRKKGRKEGKKEERREELFQTFECLAETKRNTREFRRNMLESKK